MRRVGQWLGWLVGVGMAFSAEAELLVSSFNNNRIYRYNETNGAFIDIFTTNVVNLLNLPHGLAFGPDGNLYVASAGNDSVLRYNPTNGSNTVTLPRNPTNQFFRLTKP